MRVQVPSRVSTYFKHMDSHSLTEAIAKALAEHRGRGDWRFFIRDAEVALLALADWVDELHLQASVQMSVDDSFVTTFFLRACVERATAAADL